MTEDQQLKFVVASRRSRIAAFIIDHCILTFIIVMTAMLAMGAPDEEGNNFSAKVIAVTILGLLLYFSKDSINGASPGKWVMQIMVRDARNATEIPSYGRLLLRNFFLVIWPIEFIVLATSDERRRLGDRAAFATVVKNPVEPARLPRIIFVVAAVVTFIAGTILVAGSAMKNSSAYETAVQEIERNMEIIRETGGIKGYGLLPTGSVNIENGFGEANLKITVIGNRKEVTVSAYLTKKPGADWELVEMSHE